MDSGIRRNFTFKFYSLLSQIRTFIDNTLIRIFVIEIFTYVLQLCQISLFVIIDNRNLAMIILDFNIISRVKVTCICATLCALIVTFAHKFNR